MDERLRQTHIRGLRRVVLYGPESTGKTTLARRLAAHFDTLWVSEYARAYIREKIRRTRRNCGPEDILAIAAGQQARENRSAARARHGVLICDTDLLTIRAYSDLFFGGTPESVKAALPFVRPDLYLLTDIDVPWQPDGIRDRPGDRAEMLAYYEALLGRYGRRYVKVSGDPERRFTHAVLAVGELLRGS